MNYNKRINSKLYAINYNLKVLIKCLTIHLTQNNLNRNIIFIRSRLEFLFWGLIRPLCFWMRNWIFIFESHDLLVDIKSDNKKRINRTKKAYKNFDLILSLTKSLADDIKNFVGEKIKIEILPSATGFKRL